MTNKHEAKAKVVHTETKIHSGGGNPEIKLTEGYEINLQDPIENAYRAGKYEAWEDIYLFYKGEDNRFLVQWAEDKMKTHEKHHKAHNAALQAAEQAAPMPSREMLWEIYNTAKHLSNESEGFLSQANKYDHGVTNMLCLEVKIKDCRDALLKLNDYLSKGGCEHEE